MDKKAKLLVVAFFVLLMISLLLIVYRTLVARDFDVIEGGVDAVSTHESVLHA